MAASATRERYIAKGFIKPCPYRNRKPLTLQQMLAKGYWSAWKAKMKREATADA